MSILELQEQQKLDLTTIVPLDMLGLLSLPRMVEQQIMVIVHRHKF